MFAVKKNDMAGYNTKSDDVACSVTEVHASITCAFRRHSPIKLTQLNDRSKN
jgi:hypothetical protein